jgi:flagellar motor protein MotB
MGVPDAPLLRCRWQHSWIAMPETATHSPKPAGHRPPRAPAGRRRWWPWIALIALVIALAVAFVTVRTDPIFVAREANEKAQAALAGLPAETAPGDVVATLNGVTLVFTAGSVEVPTGSEAVLQAAARAIAALPEQARLQVIGYVDTDEPGTREQKFRRSLERAANVVEALQAHGVAPERVSAIGRGDQAMPSPRPKRHIEFRIAI